jgi:tetrahydromethanopterin S-methyltransferase subunit B
MVKPPLRTKTLGTKVSEEEFAQLEAAASERGLTLSEWCRETLLGSVNGQEPQAAEAGTGQAAVFASSIMAELVALRAILLNVLFKLATRSE